MNNENDFNGYLSKEIRKLGTAYKAVKLSDKFKIGLPDWFMFHQGLTVAVESKFFQRFPKRGRVLKHPVTGPQISYMKSLSLAGVPCKVIIGSSATGLVYVLDFVQVPQCGNFTVGDFAEMKACCKINRVQNLVDLLFFGVILDDRTQD